MGTIDPMGQHDSPIHRRVHTELTDALEKAVDHSCVYSPELNAALGTYVRRLHADGLPPERMLVHIKDLVYSTVQERVQPESYDHDHFRTFIADVVRRCIQAYYRDD